MLNFSRLFGSRNISSKANTVSYIKRCFGSSSSMIRNDDFSTLSDSDIDTFKTILKSENTVIQDPEELSVYNTDWMKKYIGDSKIVLKPKTTQEVSDIWKYCNQRRLAIVPQGGNTGLVGGSVPIFDEIILSLSRMNQIKHFDQNYSIVHTQAGVVLEKLAEYLQDYGHMPPIDLGAKGSCHIGGNLATNAGGIKLIKYNSMHANCIGIEAVLADGTIINDMKGLRKDNTGYDLKQLFIGSEGTLGIITECAILWPRLPTNSSIALILLENFEKVTEVLPKAKQYLGESLTAIEFFDHFSDKLRAEMIGTTNPIESSEKDNVYMLIECSSFDEPTKDMNEEKLMSFIETLDDTVLDGVIAQDGNQNSQIWKLREELPVAYIEKGLCLKYDFSIGIQNFNQLIINSRERVGGLGTAGGYGHVGK